MGDGNERCATPASPMPEYTSTYGNGFMDLLRAADDDDDGPSSVDDDGGSPVCGSSSVDEGDDGSSSSTEDDDDGCDSSSEEEVDDGSSSVGTELALELARWEVEWEPEPEPTEVDKALEALHVIRCLQFTEHDPKLGYRVPTCLCQFNIALYDFEKESTAGLGPPLRTQVDRPDDWMSFEESINVVSLKMLESDVGYPISVFGTVLARDQVDYKCVYLFRRDREDPQFIASPDDTSTLTGPFRGLAATSHTFFEVNRLKIRTDDGDRDFSKGLVEHWSTNDSHTVPIVTRLLPSWMSTLQLVYTSVPFALEATLAVSILKGPCNFTGKVIAWTSGNENHIVLHDSVAAGTVTVVGDGGSVPLYLAVWSLSQWTRNWWFLFVFRGMWTDRMVKLLCRWSSRHDDGERICKQGPCELQVRVDWTRMLKSRRHRVFETVGDSRVLV